MHEIFFSFKRAHHASLRLSRPILAEFGLTPARFDALYKIQTADGMMQTELREALGVSRATVSRMLRSIEELGLISRKKLYDNLCNVVELTELGRHVMEKAIRTIIGSGVAQLAAESVSAWSRGAGMVRIQTRRLAAHLRWVRYALKDGATLSYESDTRTQYCLRRCLDSFYRDEPHSPVFSAEFDDNGGAINVAAI